MLWLLFSITHVFAATDAPELVRTYPHEVLRNESVEFRPVDGHHFSFEAPQNCGSGSLNEKNPRTIKCQFLQAGETQATLNVCDDKKTYCKPVQLKVNVNAKAGETAALRKNEHINKELKKTLIAGFVEGTPSEITAQAAAKGQPVLLMVSTDWCPPCNESKEFLLPSEAFKSATKDWFKVYVDGDSAVAADWEKAVPYQYFPSYILLNSQFQEIARYNGELRRNDFAAWAKAQTAFLHDPIAELRERVSAREAGTWKQKLLDLWHGVTAEQKQADRERLLVWALDQKKAGVIAELLADGDYPKQKVEILQWKIDDIERIEKEEKKDLKADKIKVYEAMMEATLKTDHWAAKLASYCETDTKACRAHLAQVNEHFDYLEKLQGMTPAEKESLIADEYANMTETYHMLEEKGSLKEFASRCVQHFEGMQKDSALKISRAGMQGMVSCLEFAGDFAREEKLLSTLIATYPNEPTFLWRMARMRKKQKKAPDALAWIGKAEERAYGYNWFSIQLLKAEILLSEKRKDEAKKVIEAALAQVSLDASSESRNQRLVARFRNMESAVTDLK